MIRYVQMKTVTGAVSETEIKMIDADLVKSIPISDQNADYKIYKNWLDQGNTPEPPEEEG